MVIITVRFNYPKNTFLYCKEIIKEISMFSNLSTIHFYDIRRKYQHLTVKSMFLKTLYQITSRTIGIVDMRGWVISVLYVSTGFL